MSRFARLRSIAPKILGVSFVASGILHFARPETFTSLVPRFIPASPESMVYASGAVEIVCAYGLFRDRRWGGVSSALLLVTFFSAHIQMLVDFQREYGNYSKETAAAWVRLPLQLLLIWAALQAGRDRARTDDRER